MPQKFETMIKISSRYPFNFYLEQAPNIWLTVLLISQIFGNFECNNQNLKINAYFILQFTVLGAWGFRNIKNKQLYVLKYWPRHFIELFVYFFTFFWVFSTSGSSTKFAMQCATNPIFRFYMVVVPLLNLILTVTHIFIGDVRFHRFFGKFIVSCVTLLFSFIFHLTLAAVAILLVVINLVFIILGCNRNVKTDLPGSNWAPPKTWSEKLTPYLPNFLEMSKTDYLRDVETKIYYSFFGGEKLQDIFQTKKSNPLSFGYINSKNDNIYVLQFGDCSGPPAAGDPPKAMKCLLVDQLSCIIIILITAILLFIIFYKRSNLQSAVNNSIRKIRTNLLIHLVPRQYNKNTVDYKTCNGYRHLTGLLKIDENLQICSFLSEKANDVKDTTEAIIARHCPSLTLHLNQNSSKITIFHLNQAIKFNNFLFIKQFAKSVTINDPNLSSFEISNKTNLEIIDFLTKNLKKSVNLQDFANKIDYNESHLLYIINQCSVSDQEIADFLVKLENNVASALVIKSSSSNSHRNSRESSGNSNSSTLSSSNNNNFPGLQPNKSARSQTRKIVEFLIQNNNLPNLDYYRLAEAAITKEDAKLFMIYFEKLNHNNGDFMKIADLLTLVARVEKLHKINQLKNQSSSIYYVSNEQNPRPFATSTEPATQSNKNKMVEHIFLEPIFRKLFLEVRPQDVNQNLLNHVVFNIIMENNLPALKVCLTMFESNYQDLVRLESNGINHSQLQSSSLLDFDYINTNYYNQTSFMCSCSSDSKLDLTSSILKSSNNVNVNAIDLYENTSLFYAIRSDSINTVKLLLNHRNLLHLNLNFKNKFGQSAFWYAAKYNRPEIFELLLDSVLDDLMGKLYDPDEKTMELSESYKSLNFDSYSDFENHIKIIIEEAFQVAVRHNHSSVARVILSFKPRHIRVQDYDSNILTSSMKNNAINDDNLLEEDLSENNNETTNEQSNSLNKGKKQIITTNYPKVIPAAFIASTHNNNNGTSFESSSYVPTDSGISNHTTPNLRSQVHSAKARILSNSSGSNPSNPTNSATNGNNTKSYVPIQWLNDALLTSINLGAKEIASLIIHFWPVKDGKNSTYPQTKIWFAMIENPSSKDIFNLSMKKFQNNLTDDFLIKLMHSAILHKRKEILENLEVFPKIDNLKLAAKMGDSVIFELILRRFVGRGVSKGSFDKSGVDQVFIGWFLK